MAAALADVLPSVVLHRALYGLGYLGGQNSGTDGFLAPRRERSGKLSGVMHLQSINGSWNTSGNIWDPCGRAESG